MKLQKGLLVMALGGTIIVSAITMERTSTYIESLKEEISSKNSEIGEVLKENKKLTTKNKGLLDKNEELNNKIEDLSFKHVLFNPNNITQSSNVGSKQLEIVFKANDRYSALRGLGQSFVDAERQYGVNAMFLLGLVSQESDYNQSDRAIRDNNLGGIGVYSPQSKGKSFSSKHDSIMYIAKLLSEDYLSTEGKHYKGKDIWSVNKTYCITEDKFSWSKNIIKIANTYVNEINRLTN